MKHYAGMERHTLRNTIKRDPSPQPAEHDEPRRGSEPRVGTAAPGGRFARPVDAEPLLFATRHLRYDATASDSNAGPSLTDTVDLLHTVVRFVEDELLRAAEPAVRARIVSDLRRIRYTQHAVQFTYHAVRLRMLEAAEDRVSAEAEARALRDVGEALRAEQHMPKLAYGDRDEPWYRFLENGLTATWVVEFYAEAMRRYGLEIPETRNRDGQVI